VGRKPNGKYQMKYKITTLSVVALLFSSGLQHVFAQSNTLTVLHDFTAVSGGSIVQTVTNSDGAFPRAGLTLLTNVLFGTAQFGGPQSGGAVFRINTDGLDFTNLHSFTEGTNEGAWPTGPVLSGTTLYGTTQSGGLGGDIGTVFRVNTDGSNFTNLYSFTALTSDYYTNADGAGPLDGVIISGSTLYGMAEGGGLWGNGTVFRLNTGGSGFTNLHSFSAFPTNLSLSVLTNGDGSAPYAGLILSGNTLFGTTEEGGLWGGGTIFRLNTDGSGFTNLHNFNLVDEIEYGGSYPSLVLSGNTLYGTAAEVGEYGSTNAGSIFKVNTDGSDFTNLYEFTGGSDGGHPHGLILSGDTLYGTAAAAAARCSSSAQMARILPPFIVSPQITHPNIIPTAMEPIRRAV
jgi:uncharacterized repeat protein (TIGR03803 family)